MSAVAVSVPRIEKISELESEALLNFTAKFSLEIIEEELEYYYSSKQKLIELVIANINAKDIATYKTENLLRQHLFNKDEMITLIRKTEKRVNREVFRSFMNDCEFGAAKDITDFNFDNITLQIEENLKTLKVCNTLAKTIDIVWKKTSKEFIPKKFLLLVSKFKVSDYIMSLAGVKPSGIEADVKKRLAKIVHGMLRQEFIELRRTLRSELINRVYIPEPIIAKEHVYEDIKTA